MTYVIRNVFTNIFDLIRDSSDGTFDYGPIRVIDLKSQQDQSCTTGTWCTDLNLSVIVPTVLTNTQFIPCEDGSGSNPESSRIERSVSDIDFDDFTNIVESLTDDIQDNLNTDDLQTAIAEEVVELQVGK